MDKHTIGLYVANKPGVLIRVSLVFARRGYNLDSLVVSEAHDPAFSRMNIVARGDKKTLDQILKQLNKLVDVVEARDYSNEQILQKEMAMVKISCTPEQRTEVLQITTAFKCKTVDLSDTTMTFQITGDSEKVDAFHKMMNKFVILELVRTGKILMARGEEITNLK